MVQIASIGVHIMDVLGRPVSEIPPGQNIALIDEIRVTVAGTAGATAVDDATPANSSMAETGQSSTRWASSGMTWLSLHCNGCPSHSPPMISQAMRYGRVVSFNYLLC